jgi:hypothetical protein
MQKLPIGIQSFEKIRLGNYLYVDKTKQILQLIQNGKCRRNNIYFSFFHGTR